MKAIALNIVLVLLCGVLAVLLYMQQKRAADQQVKAGASLLSLSNELVKASTELIQERTEKTDLTNNLVQQSEQILAISNELTTVVDKLAKAEQEAKANAEAVEATKKEVARRDTKINDLENQRDDLSRRMGDLTNSIVSLSEQIDSTEKKLAASEGDRTFLLQELKRLQTEKAELEKQLNSLAFLREQVKKLREELSVQRRLDWIRRGILSSTTMKGAERMQTSTAKTGPSTNYNLNVELRQDGTVRVAPASTNTPPATNAVAPNP